MSFLIDKQTLDELNLLGKFRQDSVYHLFNRTRTRGGEQLLDTMFRQPLNEADKINQRSRLFSYFEKKGFVFPFDSGQVTLMQEHLDAGTAPAAWLVFIDAVLKKGLSVLARDERYKNLIQRIHAVIDILVKCRILTQELTDIPEFYQHRIVEIRKIFTHPALLQLTETDIYREIPMRKLASYEYLIRRKFRQQMTAILSFVYELDVYIAVGTVARERKLGYAMASYGGKGVFSAANLRHPCLSNAVGNTIVLDEQSNVFFLTGANMAGKSTLMKSVGIAFYLAHIGFPVAASEMQFSIRDGLYSSINVADNVGLGYSHFYAEVMRVKEAALAAGSGKKLLIMFDELFKGTNVKDAYDGTLAVTEAFSQIHSCLFIVSTHIIEVGLSLKRLKNIRFEYMPTVMEGSRPRYTYQLKPGITEDRQGMLIIRNEGILDILQR